MMAAAFAPNCHLCEKSRTQTLEIHHSLSPCEKNWTYSGVTCYLDSRSARILLAAHGEVKLANYQIHARGVVVVAEFQLASSGKLD